MAHFRRSTGEVGAPLADFLLARLRPLVASFGRTARRAISQPAEAAKQAYIASRRPATEAAVIRRKSDASRAPSRDDSACFCSGSAAWRAGDSCWAFT